MWDPGLDESDAVTFTFPTVIYNRGKVLESAQEISKISSCFVLWSHETGSTAKKVTASESAKPGPHIHIYFLSQGSRLGVERGTKSEKVCVCVCDAFLLASISPYISKVRSHFWLKLDRLLSVYGVLMLLNFCGDWGRGLGARTKLLGVSN